MNKSAMVAIQKGKPTAQFYLAAEAKLTYLQTLSTDELLKRNDEPTEKVETANGRKGTIDVIVEREDEDTAFVVVQGFLPWRFLSSIKDVYVDGFRKRSDGTITELKAEELYDYDSSTTGINFTRQNVC